MKTIMTEVKKIVFALATLYSFNLIMNTLNIFIPINIYTVVTLSLLGFPGLFILVGLTTLL